MVLLPTRLTVRTRLARVALRRLPVRVPGLVPLARARESRRTARLTALAEPWRAVRRTAGEVGRGL
ncbi:MAG TPA: hypothetical protein PKM36_08345 [Propionibacteriaceae bacterium]|nr:hypothetical protein [Propionibacteriaceae bacterium]HQE31480.1 hypothetical protein [Propionibacteriaceae bacterium]